MADTTKTNKTMNTNWQISTPEQKVYLTTMFIEHFDEYSAQAFSERHFCHQKKQTIAKYLVPTLLDLVHLKFDKPGSEQEVLVYKELRNNHVKELLATKATIGKLRLIIKKAEAADEWTDAEQSFPVAGDVVKTNYKAEVEVLADLFGYDNLLTWAQ
ncbi:hypothetical protein [Absidia glauca]|uniref:Uncharacterized protein n=1 Tax=Absidia glauca TaxID=4829 RepID=A0A168M0S5_ABSGL|nr:hypothetical protein [Absidia glauca]